MLVIPALRKWDRKTEGLGRPELRKQGTVLKTKG